MGIAEKAIEFAGKVAARTGPAIQQLGAAAQAAGQSIANTAATGFGQVRNQMANFMPLGEGSIQARTQQFLGSIASTVPGSVQRTASQAGGIIPSAMEALNMPGSAAVRGFQQMRGDLYGISGLTASRAMGYGLGAATGLGALGAGYVAGSMAQKAKQRGRVAGQNLGAQLGVQMPTGF